MSGTFCPASMCPLFAKDGSPWTGDKNAECPQDHGACQWWQGFGGCGCDGATAARLQIAEVARRGWTLQVGPIQQRRGRVAPRSFDCPRAADCQWQREAGEKLCPPRLALAQGIDPRACAY